MNATQFSKQSSMPEALGDGHCWDFTAHNFRQIPVVEAADSKETPRLNIGVISPADKEGRLSVPVIIRQTIFDTLSVHTIETNTVVRVEPKLTYSDYIFLLLCTDGQLRLKNNKNEQRLVDQGYVIVGPDQGKFDIYLEKNSAIFGVMIPRSKLEAKLAEISGITLNKPLVFNQYAALNLDLVYSWMRTVRFFLRELVSACEDGNRARLSGYENILISSFLVVFPHNYSEQINSEQSQTVPKHVRLAEGFMRAHYCKKIALQDLIVVSGVSISTLMSAFRKHRNSSPMMYLRNLRLDKAQQELLQLDAKQASVTDVAARCGFEHFGRFSTYYKERFGESPSTTLRSCPPTTGH